MTPSFSLPSGSMDYPKEVFSPLIGGLPFKLLLEFLAYTALEFGPMTWLVFRDCGAVLAYVSYPQVRFDSHCGRSETDTQ